MASYKARDAWIYTPDSCQCKGNVAWIKNQGAYHCYHLDYVHHGKKTTRFIRAGQLQEVRRQLANFKKLRRWVDQWITLSLERAEILRQAPTQTE